MSNPGYTGTMNLAPIDPLIPFVRAMGEYLGMSRSSAYRALDAGEVKVVKVGGATRIRQSEIIRLQAAYEAKTEVAA